MNAKLKILIITLSCISIYSILRGQDSTGSKIDTLDSAFYLANNIDHIFGGTIKTVILKSGNSEYLYPIIAMGGNDYLEFSFDVLSENPGDYKYTITLCDANWKQAEISPFDYLEGFEENPIEDYEPSFNTLIPYYHYRLQIPNNDVSITKPGNYVLKVYENSNRNQPLILRRFMLVDPIIDIDATVNRAKHTSYANTGQEIDFTLHTKGYTINNPYQDLKVIILQNGRWDVTIDNLAPQYVNNDQFIYNYDMENVFDAGNEFRFFNCKNLRFTSENIRQIEYIDPYYHILLESDEIKQFKQYFNQADLNGSFKIDRQNAAFPETEADYVYVYFNLPASIPYMNSQIYITGAFNAWDKTYENRMIYNYDKFEYQLKLLLKQGYYNYSYTKVSPGNFKGESGTFEGSHYETENDYLILVYYYDYVENYDQLIGFEKINSRTGN